MAIIKKLYKMSIPSRQKSETLATTPLPHDSPVHQGLGGLPQRKTPRTKIPAAEAPERRRRARRRKTGRRRPAPVRLPGSPARPHGEIFFKMASTNTEYAFDDEYGTVQAIRLPSLFGALFPVDGQGHAGVLPLDEPDLLLQPLDDGLGGAVIDQHPRRAPA